MFRLLKNIGRSIFFKLVIVFVATAVVLVVAVGAIVSYVADDGPHRGLIGRNLAQYCLYIVERMGSPPDLEVAQRLVASLRFGLAIRTPFLEWSSEQFPDRALSASLDEVPGFANVAVGRERGRRIIRVRHPAAEYMFVFGRIGDWGDHSHGGVLLLVLFVVALILTLSYLAVRWLFKPLKWLTGGMEQIGDGQLGATIPVRKHDELGELAAKFNDMSARIRGLVRSKEQLLLDVSHELRSPLTRMKLSAEFIDDSKVRERVMVDLKEMEAMTTELLESERLSSAQGGLALERLDLTAMLAELVEVYADQPPGVRILTGEPSQVRVDPERMRILFRNVLDNAVKYSGEQDRPVEIAVHDGPEKIRVTVQDFGEGIPEQDQSLVFEPFYRVDKSRHRNTGGYGLGLSLCKKIMLAHGGDIRLRSRPGEGSTFVIDIPRAR